MLKGLTLTLYDFAGSIAAEIPVDRRPASDETVRLPAGKLDPRKRYSADLYEPNGRRWIYDAGAPRIEGRQAVFELTMIGAGPQPPKKRRPR